MPRARTLGEEEQAANLERRAVELRFKKSKKHVNQIMNAHPHVAQDVLKYLSGLGLKSTDTAATRAQPSLTTQAMAERAAKRKRGTTEQDESLAALPADQVFPNNAMCVSQLKLPDLQSKVLAKLEPGSLSVANLKTAFGRSSSESVKQMHLQLYTLCTGFDPDTPISGKMRIWKNFWAAISSASIARGRRCQDIMLPADMEVCGNFEIVEVTDSITVLHKHTQQKQVLPLSLPPGISSDDCKIAFNWSESRASIVSKNNSFLPISFCQYFRIPPPPMQLALTDAPRPPAALSATPARRPQTLALPPATPSVPALPPPPPVEEQPAPAAPEPTAAEPVAPEGSDGSDVGQDEGSNDDISDSPGNARDLEAYDDASDEPPDFDP